MIVFDIAERLKPGITLIVKNIDGKRVYAGTEFMQYCDEWVLNSEVEEIDTTFHGSIILTII